MFDVGFSEIVVIAVVALIVIGPERLPKVARTLGHMFGRLQRYVNEVKADINREMELDELRKLQTEVQSAARDIEHSMTSAVNEAEAGVRSVEAQLNAAEAANAAPGTTDANADASAARPAAPDPGQAAPPVPAGAPANSGETPRQAALPGFERI
jgi:sec-independent protein translocase protein TatB